MTTEARLPIVVYAVWQAMLTAILLERYGLDFCSLTDHIAPVAVDAMWHEYPDPEMAVEFYARTYSLTRVDQPKAG